MADDFSPNKFDVYTDLLSAERYAQSLRGTLKTRARIQKREVRAFGQRLEVYVIAWEKKQ